MTLSRSSNLGLSHLVGVVKAAGQRFLAERNDVGRVRQVPRLVTPPRARRAAARLYLVDDEVDAALWTEQAAVELRLVHEFAAREMMQKVFVAACVFNDEFSLELLQLPKGLLIHRTLAVTAAVPTKHTDGIRLSLTVLVHPCVSWLPIH